MAVAPRYRVEVAEYEEFVKPPHAIAWNVVDTAALAEPDNRLELLECWDEATANRLAGLLNADDEQRLRAQKKLTHGVPDRDRRYFLKPKPSEEGGVSFQLVGVMDAPVFLTWDIAEAIAHELERVCGTREKEILGHPPALTSDGEHVASTPEGVRVQVSSLMGAPVFLTWEQAMLLCTDIERLCAEHKREVRKPTAVSAPAEGITGEEAAKRAQPDPIDESLVHGTDDAEDHER